MSVSDVLRSIQAIFKQNRRELSKAGSHNKQVVGTYKGVRYILGVNSRARIHSQ